MGERDRPALLQSVFVRLLGIMLAMSAVLLLLVAGFYLVVVIPGIRDALDREVSRHVRAIADSHPDLTAARDFAEKLNMKIRYEGTDGDWTTDDGVPRVADIGEMNKRAWINHVFIPRRTQYVAPVANGHYIFVHSVGADFARAHMRMVMWLLTLMAGAFITSFLVLRRALRPLRLLGAGVARLSEGQLDVVVPRQSRDEIGVLTDAFNQMSRRVGDMVRARDQLLRDVSHELRSPLTRMKVALEMLPDGSEKRSMSADVIEMELMVTELLELERLREGGGLRLERTDVVDLARALAERYRDRAPGVRVTARPEQLYLDLDPDAVRTVLRNLIENALKFSFPDSRAVDVHIEAHGGRTQVRVSDDGPGIPEGDVEKLFEPFFRPDPSRSKKTGGYGLGLSICKRIMEAHGGTIAVERHHGRGATLLLAFPSAGSAAS